MAFEITMIQAGPVADITLSGELDVRSFDRYLQKLDELEAAAGELTKLVLRMQDLDYIASGGIRALLMSKQRLGSKVTIYVVAPQEEVWDTMCQANLHRTFVKLDDYPATTA